MRVRCHTQDMVRRGRTLRSLFSPGVFLRALDVAAEARQAAAVRREEARLAAALQVCEV
jgi:hypothetical protein